MGIYEKCYKEKYGEEFEAWKGDTTDTYNKCMDELINSGVGIMDSFRFVEAIISATREEYGD